MPEPSRLTYARTGHATHESTAFSHGSPSSPHSSQIANHGPTISTNGRFCAKVVLKRTPGCLSARYYYHVSLDPRNWRARAGSPHTHCTLSGFLSPFFFTNSISLLNRFALSFFAIKFYVNRLNNLMCHPWSASFKPQASNFKPQQPSARYRSTFNVSKLR